jgi:hypothetical protein
MSDGLNAGDSGQRRQTPPHTKCERCGGMNVPQTILDAREGKSYRLMRCFSCEKLSWSEQ